MVFELVRTIEPDRSSRIEILQDGQTFKARRYRLEEFGGPRIGMAWAYSWRMDGPGAISLEATTVVEAIEEAQRWQQYWTPAWADWLFSFVYGCLLVGFFLWLTDRF